MIVGGLTTSELLLFSMIIFFLDWEPNFVIVPIISKPNVNDTKSQFVNNNKASILYKILSKFKISKKNKRKILYIIRI